MTTEMPRPAQKRNLDTAKAIKNDEFYTQMSDIERELLHYQHHFRGKTVLCNCDDPWVSNFFRYFARNFEFLKLKKLVTTCYKSQRPDIFSRHDSEKAIYLEYAGDLNNNRAPDPDEIGIEHLQSDGDFRNSECIALMRQADVVSTNPPFSLFREYVAQLVSHKKKFLIVGNKNAITYKEIFSLIQANKIWLGCSPMGMDMLFGVPEESAQKLIATQKEGSSYKIVNGEVKARASAVWFTNMDTAKRHQDLILHKKYTPDEYPKYDNYDAINVDKTVDIPVDYAGVMGVPITFLDKYNPDQFEIIGQMATTKIDEFNFGYPYIQGKKKYARILIRNKQVQK